MQHFPLRSSGRCILNYLNDWLILAQSLDMLISHIDLLLIHLESLGLCVNMQRAFLPRLSRNRVGMRARLSRDRVGMRACLSWDRVEMEACLSRDRSAANLSSLRLFRQGSSVQLKDFQRLLGLRAADSAVCHLGLLQMRPLQLWLKSRVCGRRGLRDVCTSRPHRSSDATQISSAGEFPCAR